MMEQRTIWVVEEGEYSDYRVVGVFTSKDNAQTVASAINGAGTYSEATIAEWPLDPAVDAIRQGLDPYIVHMLEDGTVERCTKNEPSGYKIAGDVEMWRRTTAPAYIGTDIPDTMIANVWAKDATHAVKIANEHRAQFIANGKWAHD